MIYLFYLYIFIYTLSRNDSFLTLVAHFAPSRTLLSLRNVFIATKLTRHFLPRLSICSRNSRFPYVTFDLVDIVHRFRERLHMQRCGFFAAADIDTSIQGEISNSQKLLGSLLIFNSKHNAITDKTITQAVTKVARLSQGFQLGNKTIDRLGWKLIPLVKTVSLLDLIDFSNAVFLHFIHNHAPITRILALGIAKRFDNF